MTRGEQVGVALLALRPAYVVVELVVAAAATGYSVRDDSISTLAKLSCERALDGVATPTCSPRHDLMNASFVLFGVLALVGVLLLRRRLGSPSTGLLVVAAVSVVAVGFAPLDQRPWLHAVVAAPVFLAQPVAMMTLAHVVGPDRPRLGAALTGTAIAALVGALGFAVTQVLLLPGSGALERLALWPAIVLVPFAAYAVTRGPGQATGSGGRIGARSPSPTG